MCSYLSTNVQNHLSINIYIYIYIYNLRLNSSAFICILMYLRLSKCLYSSINHLYIYIYIYIDREREGEREKERESKVKLATVVEDDPRAPFSIASTPKCRAGRNSFPWIAPLTFDMYLIMLSVKQGGINNHFCVFDMTQPGIEPRSPWPKGKNIDLSSIKSALPEPPDNVRNDKYFGF